MEDIKNIRVDLWDSGYRPIAVYTGQKKPQGEKWIERARQNPPDCVVKKAYSYCASTGILCDGLWAIDIDVDDPKMASHIECEAVRLFGTGPVRIRSGTSRRLILYKSIDENLCTSKPILFENGEKVEILGKSRKFVAYGLHPDGMVYEWRNNITPIDVPRDKLNGISKDGLERFKEACSTISPIKKERIVEEFKPFPIVPETPSSCKKYRSYALASLSSIVSELSKCLKGGRNHLLNSASMRLASMHVRGWLTREECYSGLKMACHANGLIKDDGYNAWAETCKSGWSAGMNNPSRDPAERPKPIDNSIIIALKPTINLYIEEENIKETRVTDFFKNDFEDHHDPLIQEEQEDQDYLPLDEDLTYTSGVLGDLTDWICKTGPTGNRRLALSAALSYCSMLLGRNVATPTKGSLELYVILTYPSGGGKAHQPRALRHLSDKMKIERHISGSFKSGAYIDDLLQTNPLSLSIQDEFGHLLGEMTSHKASNHLAEVTVCLRTLLGMNFSIYTTAGSRACKSVNIYSPHLSVYGLTTNSQLFKAVKSKDISNGIINRFLLIDGGEKRTFCNAIDKPDVENPPLSLLRDLNKLYMIGSPKTGNLSGAFDKNSSSKPDVYTVPWKDEAAREEYLKFEIECCCLMDADPDIGEIYARTCFYSIKLATILACSENPKNPSVNINHVLWGKKIAKQSADRFYGEVKKNMVDPLSYTEIFRKIETILKVSREKSLPPQSLQRRKLWDKVKNYCGRNASDFSTCLKELERNDVISTHVVGKKSIITLLPKK